MQDLSALNRTSDGIVDSPEHSIQIRATEIFSRNNTKVIIAFLNKIKNIDFLGQHRETALHWAAFYGNIELLSLLLQRNAQVNLADGDNSRTPLNWALKALHESENEQTKLNLKSCIKLLVRHGANPELADHRERTPLERGANNPQFLQELLRKQVTDTNYQFQQRTEFQQAAQRIIERDGDDSSDEELTESNMSAFDLKQSWRAFCQSEGAKQLNTLLLQTAVTIAPKNPSVHAYRSMQAAFLANVLALQTLCSPTVNRFYYHHPHGKVSLGTNHIHQFTDINTIQWIKSALEETIAHIFFQTESFSSAPQLLTDQIAKVIDDVAKDLANNIHLLFRQNTLNVKEQLDDQLGKELDDEKRKAIRKKNAAMKGKSSSNTFIDEAKDDVIFQVAKDITPKDKKTKIAKISTLIRGLKNRLIAEDTTQKDKLTKLFLSSFLRRLKIRRHYWGITIQRGTSNSYYVEPYKFQQSAIGLFSEMRKHNRREKRRTQDYFDQMYAFHAQTSTSAKLDELTDTSLGHFDHSHNRWHMIYEHCATLRSDLSTNLIRNNLVLPGGSYETLNNKVNQFITSKAGIEGKDIASWIRKTINGDFCSGKPIVLTNSKNQSIYQTTDQQHVKKQLLDFIAELSFLLFVCEPMRNPACFITHQMMLDLIIAGKMTWKQALDSKTYVKEVKKKDTTEKVTIRNGGTMPMSGDEMVQAARYVQKVFDDYMPIHYQYRGECDSKKAPELIKLTGQLMNSWVELTIGADATIYEISTDALIATVIPVIENSIKTTWYPGIRLSQVDVLTTGTSEMKI